MKFSTSTNIERDQNKKQQYFVTANAKQVVGQIISSFQIGVHSFNLVGSYGTGKSSFILAFENCLKESSSKKNLFQYTGQFNGFTNFHILNIVGDYVCLQELLENRLTGSHINFFKKLEEYYQKTQEREEFLIIVIDEFGKILEHAAKHNPEEEMYFLQKFTEFINDIDKNILLLTTLHQGFGAYAKGLDEEQRLEWTKVKGRFHEIVFKEPIEQLLHLAAQHIPTKRSNNNSNNIKQIYQLARDSKFIFESPSIDVAEKLSPLDIIAAHVLTSANQRYGQNERTFFSFLESTGNDSLQAFQEKKNLLYNLANVHDYILCHYNSYLTEANSDSTNWTAIRIALERVEGCAQSDNFIDDAMKIIKAIGLLNIFATSSAIIDDTFITQYAALSMNITDPSSVIKTLTHLNIIRFAKYKSKYILYEGTDVDLDAALYEASHAVRRNTDIIRKLQTNFNFKVILANAYYYKKGTPRYFEFQLSEVPILNLPDGEADGIINLLFVSPDRIAETKALISEQKGDAIIYCLFKQMDAILDTLFQIDKLQWVKECYIADETDKIAIREVDKQIHYEQSLLSQIINSSIFDKNRVDWIFKGELVNSITNAKELSKFISETCNIIYNHTPVYRNELINRHKPSSSIATARSLYFNHLLEHANESCLGFEEDRFPPEKSIYLSLLKSNGLHKDTGNGHILGAPDEDSSFIPLWNCCNEFLSSTRNKQRKIGELIKILKQPPFRLKQGLIDYWLPTFLIIKKDDYALYSGDVFVPIINREVLDLMQKNPNQFSVKAFSVEGVKLDFFKQYRKAISANIDTQLSKQSFIETIRPFLVFYKKLDRYARTTKSLSLNARNFRDIISKAKDPEKTFFEDLPESLGFKEVTLSQNPEAINSFVNVIHDAIRELRSCYNDLINSIESHILKCLKLENGEFLSYKPFIEQRYKNIRTELMPEQIRLFHNRIIAPFSNKSNWIEAICYVVLKKPLEDIKDEEKAYLFASLKDSFFSLDDYVEMHKLKNESVLRVHITQNNENSITKQVILPKNSLEEVTSLENKIEAILLEDESLNISALLNILKKKI